MKDLHTTKAGHIMRIKDMSDSHLQDTIHRLRIRTLTETHIEDIKEHLNLNSYLDERKRRLAARPLEYTDRVDNIVCPHCGEEDFDSWEQVRDEDSLDCDCGGQFQYTRNTEVTYTTVKVVE